MSKLHDKIGSFTAVPNSVIQLWPVIGLDAFGLFTYLRFRTNSQSGDAFPSYDLIQAETGIGRRRIAKAIRVLEDHHLLERKKRFSQATIYTLTLPPISNTTALMEAPISNTVLLPLVTPCASNKIELTKQNNISSPDGTADSKTVAKVSTTRQIQVDFEKACGYTIDWAAGAGRAAKWLSENGYAAVDVAECYKSMKADEFWRDKQLSLDSVKKRIGEFVKTRKKVTVTRNTDGSLYL